MHTKRTLLLAILLALLTVITTMTQAQNTPILTIALQEFTQDTLDSAVFDAFEAQYGVDVVAVAPGNRAFFTENSGDIDDHLNEFAQYAGFADVLPLNWWQLSTEATRAGYLLDLLPLTNTDPTFDPNFYNPCSTGRLRMGWRFMGAAIIV